MSANENMEQGVICTAIQKGMYAEEGLRLCRSIRRFHPINSARIFAFYPQGTLRPDWKTLYELKALGVTLLRYDDQGFDQAFPLIRKLEAMSHFEARFQHDFNRVVWCDADVVCLGDISQLVQVFPARISACPVRGRGIATRPSQPFNEYWSKIIEVCKSPPQMDFTVIPTHGGKPIRPYFNCGVIGYPSQMRLFSNALGAFKRILAESCVNEWSDKERYYLEQAVISETILALRRKVPLEIVDLRWNCSLRNLNIDKVKDVRLLHHNHHLTFRQQAEIERRLRRRSRISLTGLPKRVS